MSIHIAAKQGEIADKILLPGDPLRAKFIAENFLEDAVCFNEVRNMFGYTGTYKGERVSVMGTGMGMPSIASCSAANHSCEKCRAFATRANAMQG